MTNGSGWLRTNTSSVAACYDKSGECREGGRLFHMVSALMMKWVADGAGILTVGTGWRLSVRTVGELGINGALERCVCEIEIDTDEQLLAVVFYRDL